MRALPLLMAALFVATALAALPSAEAAPPIQCVMAPCGPQGLPEPTCKPADRHDAGGAIHTTVSTDCHVQIDYKAYDCVWNCGWHVVVDGRYLTVREYRQNGDATSRATSDSGLQPPPQCVTSPCCFAPCPPPCYSTESCPTPTPVRCPAKDITPVTSAVRLPVGTVVAAGTDSDCSASACVDLEGGNVCDGQACASGDATCCDTGARSACGCEATSVATSDFFAYMGPHGGVAIDQGCKASVWHDGIPVDCTCDPLPVATSAAVGLPPMQCVMDPCGPPCGLVCSPQCIVPCVPQVVPSDCELREATPETVGPFLIPANPRTMVWGSDPSDCTVDVEPTYECVGGWGEDRHVVVGFVDVTVRLCGQPLPDIH